MKRTDVNKSKKQEIEDILKKYTEESDVTFMIDEMYFVGDILDFDKDTEKLNIYLKCSDLYSFFDERDEDELLKDAQKEIKKIKEINFIIETESCPYKHQEIDDFLRENMLRYKKELEESDTPNIFNNTNLREKFIILSRDQRGYPEHEMREAQKFLGGGVYSNLLEHIGDLTHRMSQKIYIDDGDVHLGINDMYSKLENGINSLRNGDDFEHEVQRNRKSNFEYNKNNTENFGFTSYDEFNKKCDSHSERYKKEHAKLTVYNDMQHAAKYAAIHLSNGDFKKSLDSLVLLKNAIDDGSYSKKASIYNQNYEHQSLELILNKINSKYKKEIDKLIVNQSENIITLSDIVIKENFRDEGLGTEIVEELVKFAKNNKLLIKLTPNNKDLDYGTKSKNKLIKFYKKLGFKENKGSKRDFEFNASDMILDFRGEKSQKLKLR